MAKEIDQTFNIGDPARVEHIDGSTISYLLSRTDDPHKVFPNDPNSKAMYGRGEDNQRRTANYYIIADDALLDGC